MNSLTLEGGGLLSWSSSMVCLVVTELGYLEDSCSLSEDGR